MSTFRALIRRAALALFCAVLSGALVSVPTAASANWIPQGRSVLSQDASGYSSYSSGFHGSLGVSTTSYFSNPGALQQSQFSLLEIEGRGAHLGQEVELGLEYQFAVGLQCPDCNGLELPEAYVGSSRELGRWGIQLGRVRKDWSMLDRDWSLGIFEPRYVYDYLHPESVGLLGLFTQYRWSGGAMTFFASPIFIPDRGLPVSFENGKIGSVDPFFHAPISEVVYQNQVTPVQYLLRRPPMSELLLKPSAGIMLRAGNSQSGLSVSGSYAYKPINQLLLAYSALYNLSFEVADAEVYPRVLMHHVASADLAYLSEYVTTGVSLLREIPVRDETPRIWNTQEVAPAWALSPTAEFRPMGRRPGGPILSASALRVVGGNASDQGPLSVDEGSAFERRYPQGTAIRIAAEAPFLGRSRIRTQALLDLEHDGQVYTHSIQGRINSNLSWSMAADILYSAQAGSDFIANNRTNDRFSGGVAYVF